MAIRLLNPVRDPLLNAAILANTDMVAQGIQDISKLNIINMSFWDTYMSLGGSGCTLGLVIAILLLSKREDYRAIAKLETAPAIFEINEPYDFRSSYCIKPIACSSIYSYSVGDRYICLFYDKKLVLQVYVFMQCHGQPHRF